VKKLVLIACLLSSACGTIGNGRIDGAEATLWNTAVTVGSYKLTGGLVGSSLLIKKSEAPVNPMVGSFDFFVTGDTTKNKHFTIRFKDDGSFHILNNRNAVGAYEVEGDKLYMTSKGFSKNKETALTLAWSIVNESHLTGISPTGRKMFAIRS